MRGIRLRLLLLVAGTAACGRHTAPPPSPLQNEVLRADQAPVVGLPDIVSADSLIGRRVRVLGWCASAPNILVGGRTGVWLLGTPDTVVEVRGLVPSACLPAIVRQTLVVIFAQIVRAGPWTPERLLLRLPD
ncbi:MAG: hypothetical protein ABI661_07540 [Gammaproteobacteria bacterium]